MFFQASFFFFELTKDATIAAVATISRALILFLLSPGSSGVLTWFFRTFVNSTPSECLPL